MSTPSAGRHIWRIDIGCVNSEGDDDTRSFFIIGRNAGAALSKSRKYMRINSWHKNFVIDKIDKVLTIDF